MHLGTKCVLVHTILLCVAQVQHAYYEMCVGTKIYIPIHDVRTEL